MITTRRQFLHRVGMLALGSAVVPAAQAAEPMGLFSGYGATGGPAKAAELAAQGVTFLTGSTMDFLAPDKDEALFAHNLKALGECRLPMLACNGFIRPSHLRCVGADANHDVILAWAEICLRRLKQAGGRFIVFGSGGSRHLRGGWPVEKADTQFVALLKSMGGLAQQHGITVAVEQLNQRECNFINRLEHGARLIRQTNHPHVRLLADLYHMAAEGDTPEDLRAAMDVVVHVEIAEKEGRCFPGVGGQDFRPFFSVLKQAGYRGAINIEGKGTTEQLGPAITEIKRQAAAC